VDDCPKPKGGKFLNICTLVENQDVKYKKELLAMSCADPAKDSPITLKSKVSLMWEQYYKDFSCDGDGFIPQGNVLKYSIHQGFNYFVDGVIREFSLNINLKDPSDNKTLLDFTQDQINQYKSFADYKNNAPDALKRVKDLQTTYDHLRNDLKAKHSNEL
jgi:hypothetical protein